MVYLYQICLVIFLLQGISLPFLLIIFSILRLKQKRFGLESFVDAGLSELKDKAASNKISELILSNTPNLTPLKCANCGTGVLLRETETFCPHCETRSGLPEDYAAAMSLKSENKMLLKRAVRYWRVANIWTSPWLVALFVLLALLEAFILPPAAGYAIEMFPNHWPNTLLTSLGETKSEHLLLFAQFGIIVWTSVYISLAVEGGELRRKLPTVPILDEKVSGSETASCQSCGGAIEYDRDDFASICNYCNVENFRARFTRLKSVLGADKKAEINFALFGAMGVIERYVEILYSIMKGFVGLPILLYTLFGLILYGLANDLPILSAAAGIVFLLVVGYLTFTVIRQKIT